MTTQNMITCEKCNLEKDASEFLTKRSQKVTKFCISCKEKARIYQYNLTHTDQHDKKKTLKESLIKTILLMEELTKNENLKNEINNILSKDNTRDINQEIEEAKSLVNIFKVKEEENEAGEIIKTIHPAYVPKTRRPRKTLEERNIIPEKPTHSLCKLCNAQVLSQWRYKHYKCKTHLRNLQNSLQS